MFTDVAELREFYTSPLGQLAQRTLRRQVRQLWPDVRGLSLLGLGFSTPLLRPFLGESSRVMALMPAQQGVLHWPREGPNRTALMSDSLLPLQDASIDRIILMHGLEGAADTHAMMHEIWRVLTSGGRLIVIAPNRSGLWAQSDGTPFGHGVSFSPRQLKKLLREQLFIPEREAKALFFPPSQSAFWIRTASLWEQLGTSWLPALAGVHIIEAAKQLYAPTGKLAPATRYKLTSPQPASVGLRVS